ncbi:MAG: tetratricopeptide repeat protein, partial [Tepidiformaceae bacterium]
TTHPGFVHRDLKPENVLVTQTCTAKVTDFGFALISPRRPQDRESHPPDLVVGTPSYMAPEQWSTGRVDSRADVYALGCILFKMLTGHGPFHGASERDEWRTAHRETPAPMLPPALPAEVNELVQRCLRKDPNERFEDIEALHEALTELYRAQLCGEPREAPQANEMTAEDLNNLGNTFFHLGDLDRAIVEYEHAIEANPGLAAIHYSRAGALSSLGRFEKAIAGYGEALRLDPCFANAVYNRGNLRRDLGDEAAAIGDYTLAAGLDPALGVALHNRGLLHLHAGRRVEAVADFRAAIAASRVPDAYRSLAAHHRDAGQLAEAAQQLDCLIELGVATGADYVARARLRRALGQFSDAVGDFNVAISMGEERFPLLYERALCLRLSGRLSPAIADLTLLLKYERTNLPALRARAVLFHDLGRLDDAIADYSLITTLDENDTNAYYSIGLVLGERGQFENAFAFLREGARRGHSDAEAALRRFGLRSSVAGVRAPVTEGHP